MMITDDDDDDPLDQRHFCTTRRFFGTFDRIGQIIQIY